MSSDYSGAQGYFPGKPARNSTKSGKMGPAHRVEVNNFMQEDEDF